MNIYENRFFVVTTRKKKWATEIMNTTNDTEPLHLSSILSWKAFNETEIINKKIKRFIDQAMMLYKSFAAFGQQNWISHLNDSGWIRFHAPLNWTFIIYLNAFEGNAFIMHACFLFMAVASLNLCLFSSTKTQCYEDFINNILHKKSFNGIQIEEKKMIKSLQWR